MIKEKDKKIIDDFLKEQNFNFDEYDEFIKYIQEMGALNTKVNLLDKVFFTKTNLKQLYKRYLNPVSKTAKILGLTYKELGEKIGYTERGIQNAITKGAISNNMIKSLELLIENEKLNKENLELKEKLKSIKNSVDFL